MTLVERIQYLSEVKLDEPCLAMLVKARTAYVQGNHQLASLLLTLISREHKRQRVITIDLVSKEKNQPNKYNFFQRIFYKGSRIDKTI